MTKVKSQQHLQSPSLPIQSICHQGTKRCLPKYKFPKEFHITYTQKRWSNFKKCVYLFQKFIFPYRRAKKARLGYPEDLFSFIIIDTFKGLVNGKITSLCLKNKSQSLCFMSKNDSYACKLVIVLHNFKNRFELLDITISQKTRKFYSNQFNKSYAERVNRTPLINKWEITG